MNGGVDMHFLKKTKEIENRAESGESNYDLGLGKIFGNSEMTRGKAMQISAVAAAVNKIALTVAKLPIKLYETDENGRPHEIADDERTFLLSVDSGDTLNVADMWQAVIADYYLGGGAWLYIDRTFTGVRSIRYVDCGEINVSRNNDPIFKDYDILVGGARYYPYEFIKILRHTKRGSDSHSIITENSELLSVAYEILKFEQKQIKKGGNKRGFFRSEKHLDKEAVKELKKAVKTIYSSNDTEERSAILNDGIDFKETSATSVELQLNENKKTNTGEIFNVFGFPATVVLGGATEKDVDQFTECVINLLNVIEAALDKDLLLESEKKNRYFAFDTRELTRGKLKERYEAYEIALKNHFLQIDEVRREEDKEPLGFNYISLSLGDVLLDPKTQKAFVPNTGQSTEIKSAPKGGEKNEN